jgi:NAD(P)-dependent dehydrogenase (short-subunit alcohol dehydrogenase family)
VNLKTIVITGSTRGIGLGLAREFLKLDCNVVVSGRKQEDVNKVVEDVARLKGSECISGLACDVSDPDQVQALWDHAVERFGRVDIWINNAGTSHTQAPAWQIPSATTRAVLRANVEGLVNGSCVAYAGMLQQGGGMICNMLGLGSDGRKVAGLAIYGTSKAAVKYYTDALIEEAMNSPVKVCSLSPGMVLTDLLLKQKDRSEAEWQQLLKVYNLLADTVENVTPWMARQILENQKHGAAIRYFTFGRLLSHLFATLTHKRDIAAMMEKSE